MSTFIRKYSPLWWIMEAILICWIGYSLATPLLIVLSNILVISGGILLVAQKAWVRMLIYIVLFINSAALTFLATVACLISRIQGFTILDVLIIIICSLNITLSAHGYWKNVKKNIYY